MNHRLVHSSGDIYKYPLSFSGDSITDISLDYHGWGKSTVGYKELLCYGINTCKCRWVIIRLKIKRRLKNLFLRFFSLFSRFSPQRIVFLETILAWKNRRVQIDGTRRLRGKEILFFYP